MEDIVIVGAGGLGLETAWLIERNNRKEEKYRISGYYDDSLDFKNKSKMWVPYLGTTEELLRVTYPLSVVIAVANPSSKAGIYEKINTNKNLSYPNIICNDIWIHHTCTIGIGNIIFPDSKITADIHLGDFNLIGFNSTIGHGSKIGNYNSIYPGVTISGDVGIHNFVEIGTGANIIQQINLLDHTIIGAGCVMIKNSEGSCTIVGSPGKVVSAKE